MAGTRLAAHTCFLLFSLISVLVAWRLGVVERTPLPLKTMAQLSASSSTGQRAPLQVPVDIDIVLLRSPSNRGCPSCAAALDAMQANPSLARNAFLKAEGAAEPDAADEQRVDSEQGGAPGHRQHSRATGTPLPLFNVREVNVRVVHAEHGLDAARSAPSASSDPAALDDWLLRHFLEPPLQQQANLTLDEPGSSPATTTATATTAYPNLLSPRYTFFVGCAGGGDAGELPAFMMGKRRHGYLGLGCACSTCGGDGSNGRGGGSSSGSSSGVGDGDGGGGATAVSVSEQGLGAGPTVPDSGGLLASAAALAVLQVLAGVVVANVLRSPVPADDVHVNLGQAYRLNFSLLSEDPARRRCAWDFAGASRRYLRPMLRKLDPVASFAVQSQEVQYARLAQATPRMFSARKHWYYSPEDLKGFLGANDFSTLDLAAGWGPGGGDRGVGGGGAAGGTTDSTADGSTDSPTWAISSPHSQVAVNFMVFCPSPQHAPLAFMKEWVGAGGRNRPMAEAYEVPGFGGVSVVNGEGGSVGGGDGDVDFLGLDRLRRALGAHASQLRRIIGLPRPSDRPSDVPWPWLPQPVSAKADLKSGLNRGGDGGGTDSSLCGPCPTYRVPMEGYDDPRLLLPLTFLPSPTDGVTDWEVDALIRAGMARNRDAAAETLRSLAALVESQPEMEVSAKVAEDVAAAIEALANADAAVFDRKEAAPLLGAGAGAGARPVAQGAAGGRRNFPGRSGKGRNGVASSAGSSGGGNDGSDNGWACAGAMRWTREALRRAEAAYFDPTMVPQLYFPQDFLLAVYLPFLGPLAFPLLWGFAQELWRYLKKRKAKRDKVAAEAAQEAAVYGEDSSAGDKKNTEDEAVR